MKGLSLWAPVVLYMAAIFYVSSLPEPPPIPAGSDKPLHLSAYFGLAILVIRALAGGLARRMDARTALVALLIVIGYGVTDEVHQMFVPGRSADVYDLLSDAAGAAAGTAACWAWGILSSVSHPNAGEDARRGRRVWR